MIVRIQSKEETPSPWKERVGSLVWGERCGVALLREVNQRTAGVITRGSDVPMEVSTGDLSWVLPPAETSKLLAVEQGRKPYITACGTHAVDWEPVLASECVRARVDRAILSTRNPAWEGFWHAPEAAQDAFITVQREILASDEFVVCFLGQLAPGKHRKGKPPVSLSGRFTLGTLLCHANFTRKAGFVVLDPQLDDAAVLRAQVRNSALELVPSLREVANRIAERIRKDTSARAA